MCGRFTTTTTAADLAQWFEVEDVEDPELGPNYNVTPTSDIYTVIEDPNGQPRLDVMFWGLVPPWAASTATGAKMINARSETAAEKPSFRSAFRKRRCLIPVDGFYEWVQIPGRKKKQPMYISAQNSNPLAFAGLWENWKSSEEPNSVLRSCAILTGPPNQTIAPLHDRMPMILFPEQWSDWLSVSNSEVSELQSMLRPAPEEVLRYWPVSLDVNNVRMRDSHLIEKVAVIPNEELPGQLSVF